MAYDGGYAPQPQQRPYNGPAAPRPPPQRQYPGGPGGPGPNGPGGPPGGPYRGDYGQGGGGGYGDDYGDGGYGVVSDYEGGPAYGGNGGGGRGYEDDGYGYGAAQDYPGPGRGGRPPMPGGRGGPPPPRQMTMDGGGRGPYPPRGGAPPSPMRGGYQNGPPGRRPGPPDRANTSDPTMNRGPGGPPRSPLEGNFGGNAFPPFPGQQGRPDRYDEQNITDNMAAMDISGNQPRPPPGPGPNGPGRAPPPMRGGAMGPPRNGGGGGNGGGNGYGPPPGPLQRSYTQQDVGFSDQGYGPPPPRAYREDNFGPPSRTVTMPVSMDSAARQQPPPRNESGPYQPYKAGGPMGGPMGPPPLPPAMGGGGGRGGMPPPRPNTAQGTRPPPQRLYPNSGSGSDGGGYGYNGPPRPDPGYGAPPQNEPASRPSSFDDFYDTYYDSRESGEYYPTGSSQHRSHGSLDQHAIGGGPNQDAAQQPQRGPNRYPEINRTKSQPDLRQSQEAVFEMAGDIPPMPTPKASAFQMAQQQQPGGLPGNPAPMRRGSAASGRSGSNGDSLPSHPTPVRPGLIPNSVASQQMSNNKPMPVRNYNPGPSAPLRTISSSSSMPQQPQPQQQQQPLAPMMQQPQPNGLRPGEPAQEPPVTPELLERLRNTVKANPSDQAATLTLAKKLVEAIDVLVPTLPDPRTRTKARERYAFDAQKLLKKMASAQNPDAMFFLADCLGRGLFGQEPDNKEAFSLYQSAAKLGHASAAYRTAVCCEIGNEEGGGTRKDPLKAIQWYKRAATLGDTPAMYKVGMILLKGLLGQPRNPREAVSWLKRAAERADAENPHALHELGLLYERAQPNDVILRDEAYALELFQQAADLGYKFSQFRLGCAYEYGLLGCAIDARLSILWYSKAATQGEHQSELALSGWYLTGAEGVLQQSDTEAYLWARKAAMAGLTKAEYAMGYFTEVGIGVPANLEDAKRWYWRAAAQDFPKARERLEDLKRTGKAGPRQRERISRSKIGRQQEGECLVM
ncbi:Tetratricopeptide-like helical [Niveomyces insectorum RCEF 264]|uniref:Tetratricopeptide-like helical n=1 Tax=Niveomyces insectorum RCEF 264 TaxID=1081102 RepID=A0A167UKI7_9HYPO|nr:Tetratricopeptide-like helical [Niveomyces insectorum RCEF 264]